MATDSKKRLQIWIYPITILGTTAMLVVVGLFLIDFTRWTPAGVKPAALLQFFDYDPDTAQNALGNLAQVIAAVLGIVITVVSIVVQLASTRYTPRVAEMFFRDRTNLVILGFFVVAGIDAVWVSLSVTHTFVPHASITASLVLVTTSVLLMVPYFAYVFDFLDPEKVVARIQEQALASALATSTGSDDVAARQAAVLTSVEQLGDVTINAVSQKDKLIAQGAVDALKTLLVKYLPNKRTADAAWFTVGARLRQNPDFVSMSPESVDDLAERGVWLEFKVLRQFQSVYNESLSQMPDMGLVVAINTRYVGEAATDVGDRPALGLAVKFFNTYLRAALNNDAVRTLFNTLNQYRQLGERIIDRFPSDALAGEIAGYFRYYSQIAHSKGLSFITETAAYDLATLCEVAHGKKAACHQKLLEVLLTLDRQAETDAEEKMLRGVRKAQAKLASYYLAVGDEPHARAIFEDMKNEPPGRLRSIRDELLRVQAKDFWEVIDRGNNFDYMDEPRKENLKQFFSWFASLQAASAIG